MKKESNQENFRWGKSEEDQTLKEKLQEEAKKTNTKKSKIIKKAIKFYL